ncbi:hypothetical protein CLAIMM_12777, partial [Cladophialophora immunda]
SHHPLHHQESLPSLPSLAVSLLFRKPLSLFWGAVAKPIASFVQAHGKAALWPPSFFTLSGFHQPSRSRPSFVGPQSPFSSKAEGQMIIVLLSWPPSLRHPSSWVYTSLATTSKKKNALVVDTHSRQLLQGNRFMAQLTMISREQPPTALLPLESAPRRCIVSSLHPGLASADPYTRLCRSVQGAHLPLAYSNGPLALLLAFCMSIQTSIISSGSDTMIPPRLTYFSTGARPFLSFTPSTSPGISS